MFAGKKSAQIREILISESAWEEMTCLFAPSLAVLGVEIDTEMNNRSNSFGERIVSSENARVICAVIPTNEEKMIALDAIHLGKVNAPAEFA